MNDFAPAGSARPARPPASKTDAPVNARAEEVQSGRRRRQDTGELAGLKLHVDESRKDPRYVYRWINNDERRMQDKTVRDDWEVVTDPAIEGSGEGTPVERLVGEAKNGAPVRAILVRKLKSYFEEDKAKALRVVKEREDAIKRGAPPAPEGLSARDHQYIPDRHDGFSSNKDGTNRID